MVIDIWCALNSSFGGPLLAIVTVGGGISFGKSIISFPRKFDTANVAERNQRNTFRFWTLVFGLLTFLGAVGNVVLYLYAYALLRSGATACPISPASDVAFTALYGFYAGIASTCLFGVVYSFRMAKMATFR
ncbi:hypothetical protein CO674_25910 [Rhizobium hidalgonense]|uniref:GtrA-like protein domain-containing protein n=1 Tax=Rhizobium hidalgonense TaxID=1538159 RepID=A0ABX4JLG9_9HYPH|nr:hypothetical protein CO674_25910 [Rhizobium hidalgonense]PON07113.1 hypothetical protein ATY29_13570 [Rhizobium hidalgonense]